LFSTVGPGEFLDPQVTFGLFLWDDNAGAGIGYREIDFEYSRWGNGGDPTAAQFVLEPLRAGAMLEGWKVRFPLSHAQRYGGTGQGGGGCNDEGTGVDSFNGAAINHITCALVWGPGKLNFRCWDGLYTLATVANAPLIAAYNYPVPGNVPPPGTERWHFNLWQANAGAPAFGRRVHEIITNFEYTQNQVDFGGGNVGLQRRLSSGAGHYEETTGTSAGRLLGAVAAPFGGSTTAASAPASTVGLGGAIGIAVGASTLTAFMAAIVAFMMSRSFKGSSSLISLEGEEEPEHHETRGERRRKERVAPQ
jgi:hypothetical protein